MERFFDCRTGFAGGLLNATEQFLVLPFNVLEIVIRECGPLLFQLALGNIPVALDFECVHRSSFSFVSIHRQRREKKLNKAQKMQHQQQNQQRNDAAAAKAYATVVIAAAAEQKDQNNDNHK